MVLNVSVESIEKLVQSIREGLEYERGVNPSIIEIIETSDSALHIIASDRAEKSLLIGPGGRIVAEVSKILGRKTSIYGADEIQLKKYRLALTRRRINEIISDVNPNQREFLNILGKLISLEEDYPRSDFSYYDTSQTTAAAAIAYSGGVDSTATLVIARRAIQNVTALTIDMGPMFIDRRELERIKVDISELNITFEVIENLEVSHQVIERTESDRIHPCGMCHEHIMNTVKKIALARGFDVLLTGELLPSGRQSIEYKNGLLVVHLPAALSLSKYQTKQICNRDGVLRFGCNFISYHHRRGWRMCSPSVFRVLRELQAGVLSTGEALDLIKSILIPVFRAKKKDEVLMKGE